MVRVGGKKRLREYEHIIWDYNGTLLNDMSLCVEVINRVLERRGLDSLSESGYQQVFDFPVREYYEKIGFDFKKESFEIVGTEFVDEYNKDQYKCKLHPGANDALSCFAELSIPQSVLSARLQSSLDKEMSDFGIDHYFTHIFGLDDHYAVGKLGRGKQLIEHLNVAINGNILMIGDTLHDFEVAQTLGIDCVLLAHGHHSYERLKAKTEGVFRNLNELINCI